MATRMILSKQRCVQLRTTITLLLLFGIFNIEPALANDLDSFKAFYGGSIGLSMSQQNLLPNMPDEVKSKLIVCITNFQFARLTRVEKDRLSSYMRLSLIDHNIKPSLDNPKIADIMQKLENISLPDNVL